MVRSASRRPQWRERYRRRGQRGASLDTSTMTTTAYRGLAPVRTVLENGAVVIAKQANATPAITVHASFEAGTVFDPPPEQGVAHFVSRTIDRGTTSRPADAIAQELDNR